MIQGFSSGLIGNRELIYETDLPSFQRDFASVKTLDHGTGPAITFTRASGATYFDVNGALQTAADDVARFDHDPATGTSRGLLIEEARTNRTPYSEDFGNAAWVKVGGRVVITTNQIVAPDGNLTADFAEANGGASLSRVFQLYDDASSTGKTLSVFAKAGTASFLQLLLGADTAPWANFDLSAGTVGSTGTVLSATIAPVGNGWYRCQVATSSTTATNASFAIVSSGTAARAESNTLTTGLYIWGAQLEAGAFPTSYIPTTTAAATRSADSAVVTPISSFYNQSEGTLFAEYITNNTNNGVVSVSDNTADNRLAIITANSPAVAPIGNVRVGGVAQASITIGSTPSTNEVMKFIVAAKTDDFQAARSGTLGTADTSGSMPTLTHLRLGTAGAFSSSLMTGHIRKIAYWPKRLSNTLLEQITT